MRSQAFTFAQIAEQINEKHSLQVSESSIRHACRAKSFSGAVEKANATGLANYKESVEIGGDGTHKSDKLLRMSEQESKDVNFLLRAHGYDAEVWELISARNNIWNSYSKQDGIMTMYSSKISVKPRTSSFSFDKVISAIKKLPSTIIPYEPTGTQQGYMLEIPLFDSHFGISTYDDYKETQGKILEKIHQREWSEILFVIGQDMLHHDNFRSQTASGTQIEQVDMTQAWSDALRFYKEMIEVALSCSNQVKIIFSKGNHDESMSWAFVQLLKHKYPQVEVDDVFTERKVHIFGSNFIGITHGDKARKSLHNIFPREFPLEWASTTTHEIHIGHLHVEDAKDVFGMMIRTLATRNKTDSWHKDNGFVGAHKRFMLFEYSESELESIHYV